MKTKNRWVVLKPSRIDLLEDILLEAKDLHEGDKHRVHAYYNNLDDAHTDAVELLKINVLEELGYK